MIRSRLLYLLFFFFSTPNAFCQAVELVVQTGHSDNVYGVDFSRNGKYIASTCTDGSVKIWDARLGFQIFNFYDFNESGISVAFSPDGKYLLGTGNEELVLWDITTGKKIVTVYPDDETEDMFSFERVDLSLGKFSPDGRYVFTARNNIQRWDFGEMLHPEKFSKEEIRTDVDELPVLGPPNSSIQFIGHTAQVLAVCVSRDNKFLVSVAKDSTIRIWDMKEGKQIRKIRNQFEMNTVVITADGKRIITADHDIGDKAGIRCWDVATGRQLLFVPSKNGYVGTMAITSDDKFLVAGTLSDPIEIYSLPSFKLLRTLKGHKSWVNDVAISGDNKFIVSGGDDEAVMIWELSSGKIVRELRKTIANIDNLTYENSHRLLTTTSNSPTLQQTITWEIENGIGIKNAYNTKTHFYNDELVSMDSAGKMLMITEDSAFNFFDPNSGKLINRFIVPDIGSGLIAPGGGYAIYQDRRSNALYTIGARSGKKEFFAEYPSKDTLAFFKLLDQIDFSADGKKIAAGGIGADIYLWSLGDKRYLRNFNYLDPDSSERKSGVYHDNESIALPNAMINDLKFSPDGKWLAAASRMPDPIATGGIIIIWNVETGELMRWISAHNYIIQSINWSPDGKYLITGSNDKWMKVWEFKLDKEDESEPVYSYRHDFTPLHTSFTKDNKWILSAGIDGKLIIKDPLTYKTIATLIGLNKDDYVAVTNDQYYAASKAGTRLIAFRQGNKVYPAEQFDLKYNRPDKVLEALGSSDTNLIQSYRQAYIKRIKKAGLDSLAFRDDLTAPAFEIINQDTISYRQSKSSMSIHVSAADAVFKLDKFNVWINEVPLYGQQGIRLGSNRNKLDTTIRIDLSAGENRVDASVINSNGTESYRIPLIVNYQPIKPEPSLVHFVGIGIDQFADSEYNLEYSTKDIRDLCARLKQKFGAAIRIDTLFNRSVTRENVRNLKNNLLKTGINDKVIISYSGHGLLNKDFDYFLSTYDVNFDHPEQNGLAYDELENLLDQIPARKKLLLIDACHSGEVDKDELVAINTASDSLQLVKGLKPVGYKTDKSLGLKNSFELMQNLFVNVGKSTGATIISAAAGNQFALERNDLKNGVFTFTILEAMQKNRTMKLSELRKYVGQRVEELTKGMQKPTSRNETIAVDWDLW